MQIIANNPKKEKSVVLRKIKMARHLAFRRNKEH